MSGDTIEQLAKELFMSNDNAECHWERMPEHVKRSWRLTAKYVSRMIIEARIEARIEELYRAYGVSAESNLYGQHNRVAELRKELENL